MTKTKTAKNNPPQTGLRKVGLRRYMKKYWPLYAMMVLPVIYFIVFKYLPMFGNILAFRRYRPGMSPWGEEWAGLRYFKLFMRDPMFWSAFKNTLVLSLLNLLVNFFLPILFAILLNEVRAKRFKKFVQTISYMPRFISTVVVITILGELLSPSSGLVNLFLKNAFGIEPIYFMNEPGWFRIIYILTDSWQFTGWTAIIYLAAITGISSDLFEAAEIDGAGRLQQIMYVTIPSIMPTIMIFLLLKIAAILNYNFEKIHLLYSIPTYEVGDILSTYIYRIGIEQGRISYTTAISFFNSVVGFVLLLISNWFSKKFGGNNLF